MNNRFKKIIAGAQTFSLREAEKASILKNISLFMDENPVLSMGLIATPYWENIKEEKYKHKFVLVFAFLLIALISGATSFAANYALPGDFLYPVKTGINEKVKSLATVGPAANAKLESDLAILRLNEAEKLATKGDISLKTSDEIKKNFSKHANKVKALSATLEQKGDTAAAVKINSDLQTELETNSAILGGIQAKNENNKQGLDEVNDTVKSYISTDIQNQDKENPPLNSGL